MNIFLAILLVLHVLIGVIGVFLFGGVALGLFRKNISVRMLKSFSFLGLIAFLTAWTLGGYYYVVYYGSKVKPIIKAGNMPWAHSIVMEAKEHIFLFMPFLAFVSVISIWLLRENLNEMPKFRNAVALVSLAVILLDTC